MQHRNSSSLLRWPLLPALLLCCAVLPCAADTRVYQWTDANGTIHYGDAPKAAAKSVEVRSGSRGVDAGARLPVEIDAEACTRKREKLQRYVGAATVTETNALGETREYGEAQRQKLIEVTEAEVRSSCGEE